MKKPRTISTEPNLPEGYIHFAGDAAFAANSEQVITDPAGPRVIPGVLGGEILVACGPDPSVQALPPGIIVANGLVYSIPGTGTVLLGVKICNITAAPLNVPAFDAHYMIFPKAGN